MGDYKTKDLAFSLSLVAEVGGDQGQGKDWVLEVQCGGGTCTDTVRPIQAFGDRPLDEVNLRALRDALTDMLNVIGPLNI